MSTSPQRRSRGFTLVELLVVIGIIAVLVGILLPTLSSARQSARLVQCQSNLRQFFMADAMYLNNYKNWHLPGWTGSNIVAGLGAPKPFTSFLANQDIWTDMEEVHRTLNIPWLSGGTGAVQYRCYIPPERCCPEAVRGGNDQHQADATTGFKDWYVDYFYGMNVDGVDYNPSTPTDVVYQPVKAPQCDITQDGPTSMLAKSFHGFRSVQVRHPADKIFLCDAMYWWVNEWGSGVDPGWQGSISTYARVGERTHTGTLPTGGSYNSERTVAWRHKKSFANVCFFDGHVEAVSKDRFTIKDPTTGTLTPNLQMWRPMEN